MKYKWNIRESDTQKTATLAQLRNIPQVIAAVLLNRGLESPDVIDKFFNPRIEDLYDPFLMTDMDKAVDRLTLAFKNDEKIAIFGDYDVDGTTATTLLYLFLHNLKLDTLFYIPDREKEGYGLSRKGINTAIKAGCSLVITCDSGISGIEEIDYANAHDVDVIVTDHHEPGETLPRAMAILDPKRGDDSYPFKELCGAGVAFKLLQGFSIRNHLPMEDLYKHLDLVAVGTAADIVPILDENRIIVSKGLEYLNDSQKMGLQSLLEVSGFFNKRIGVVNIVFGIAPRLNAAGRLGDAINAINLLKSEDREEANHLAQLLDQLNRHRQSIERATIDSAILQLNATHDLEKDKIIILDDTSWHQGVIGIVASKLKEIYNRPVILISFNDKVGKGSARSIPGFDLYAALSECADLLDSYGGHKMAAGLTISENNIQEFRFRLKKIAAGYIDDSMLNPELTIDGEILFQHVNQATIDFLRNLAPFGPGNMRPIFYSRNLTISGIPRIIGENHVKFKACQDRIVISAIGWKQADLYEMLISNRPLDIAFVIEENEWRGLKEIQLNVKDIHFSNGNRN